MILKLIKLTTYNYGKLLTIVCDVILKIVNTYMSLLVHLEFNKYDNMIYMKNIQHKRFHVQSTGSSAILCFGKSLINADVESWSQCLSKVYPEKVIYDFCSTETALNTIVRQIMCTCEKLTPESIYIYIPEIFSEEYYCKHTLTHNFCFLRTLNNINKKNMCSADGVVYSINLQEVVLKTINNLHYIDSFCFLHNINLKWITESKIINTSIEKNILHVFNFKVATIPYNVSPVSGDAVVCALENTGGIK